MHDFTRTHNMIESAFLGGLDKNSNDDYSISIGPLDRTHHTHKAINSFKHSCTYAYRETTILFGNILFVPPIIITS